MNLDSASNLSWGGGLTLGLLARLTWALSVCATGLATEANPWVATSSAPTILGFDRAGTERERELEKEFDKKLLPTNLESMMRRLSAHPHHVGSRFDKENAEFLASQLKSWGYETVIEEFEVLFPTPKVREVEMQEPERFTARLEEPPLKEDSTSGLTQEQLPTYNAYSIDGDVTGELVYVNYGVPKDYETLEERGIDVKGKIVIVRYGGSWRGIKPKVAAEHGAVGCLIYSDPKDDGYFQGDVYPKGAWRNQDGTQRGSVADMPLYPGDPLTPGVGAVKGAQRLTLKEAPTLTKIPVLPISYGDALPLLRALVNGPVAPEEWRGALPITYHLGPGPAKVHLHLEFNWDTKTLYNVIAKLPGAERPDEWIIRGNHHDAWVCGADDPLSGTVALMEEARALSELHKSGWRPKRTLVFALWDGEEPCLLGSTEWVETHAEELRQKAAVYVNSDSNGRGFAELNGSHSFEKFINEVTTEVSDPEKQISVESRLRAYRLLKGSAEEKAEARERTDLRIGALGSGSDFSPFLQHLGIASLDIRYGGEDEGGSYHSIYDSFDHYRQFGDPGFVYGITLVQTTGRVLLRLANAELLPLEFGNLTDTLSRYIKEVKKLTDEQREKAHEKNRLLNEKVLEAVADPRQPFVLPKREEEVPYLNFAPLENALMRVQDSARRCDAALKFVRSSTDSLSVETARELDQALIQTERVLLADEGLPRRSWYKHLVYAPGFYTGYGVKTLPGVREAIEGKRWTEANVQIEKAAQALERLAGEIGRAATLAESKR